VVAGSAALLGAVVAWRRLGPEGRRAASFCLLASSGVAVLAWSASGGRYSMPATPASCGCRSSALAGAGLAAMPRRLAVLVAASLALPTLALSTTTTHMETSSLVPELDAEVGAHDSRPLHGIAT